MTTVVRDRKPWEAVDLGFLMARRWWWPMVRTWLLATFPLFLLLQLLLADTPWLVAVLLWWIKPLGERIHLHILSQALFGHLPGSRETLRQLPRLLRPQALAALLWRRLSPSRSMDLAVTQLEGLNGKRRRQRLAILHRQDDGPAGWLTLIGIHVESLLSLGAYGLLYALIPAEVEFDFRTLLNEQAFWPALLQNLLAYLAIGAVAPFYVGGGFALYINRRVRLEAWDIDIAFRRLRERVQRRGTARTALAGLLALWLLAPAGGAPVQAAELDADGARVEIERVMAGEDFHHKQVMRYPDLSHWFEGGNAGAADPGWLGWLTRWLPPLADSLEFLLWLGLLALILLLLFRYRRWLAQHLPGGRSRPPEPERPQSLFGLDLSPEALPADIPAAAMALWQQGALRPALSLLYRAALVQLIDRHRLPIGSQHTEQECLRLARQRLPADTGAYLAELTALWERLAYGHQALAAEAVAGLCREWPRRFPATEVDR